MPSKTKDKISNKKIKNKGKEIYFPTEEKFLQDKFPDMYADLLKRKKKIMRKKKRESSSESEDDKKKPVKSKPLPIEKTEKGNINPCINPFGFVKPKTLNIKELNELGIKPYVPHQKESQLMAKARALNVASTFQSAPIPIVQIQEQSDKKLRDDVNKIVKMDRKEREEWRKEAKKKLKNKKKKSESEEESPKPPKKVKIKEPTKEEIINNNISKMKQEYTSLDRMMLFNLVEYMYQHLDFKKCKLEKKKKDKVYTQLLDVLSKRLIKKYKIQDDMEENIDKEVKVALKLCKSTVDKDMIKGYYLDYMSRLPKKIG